MQASYLLSLALWDIPYLSLLFGSRQSPFLQLRTRRSVVAHRHTETVRDQIRHSEDDHHRCRQTGAGHTGDHGKGRYGPVYPTIDNIRIWLCFGGRESLSLIAPGLCNSTFLLLITQSLTEDSLDRDRIAASSNELVNRCGHVPLLPSVDNSSI